MTTPALDMLLDQTWNSSTLSTEQLAAIVADSTQDENNTITLTADGIEYDKTGTTGKFNFYSFGDINNTYNVKVSSIKTWSATFTSNAATGAGPFLNIYTKAKGDGSDMASWYNSRYVISPIVSGQEYSLTDASGSSTQISTSASDQDELLMVSIGTNSAHTGTYSMTVSGMKMTTGTAYPPLTNEHYSAYNIPAPPAPGKVNIKIEIGAKTFTTWYRSRLDIIETSTGNVVWTSVNAGANGTHSTFKGTPNAINSIDTYYLEVDALSEYTTRWTKTDSGSTFWAYMSAKVSYDSTVVYDFPYNGFSANYGLKDNPDSVPAPANFVTPEKTGSVVTLTDDDFIVSDDDITNNRLLRLVNMVDKSCSFAMPAVLPPPKLQELGSVKFDITNIPGIVKCTITDINVSGYYHMDFGAGIITVPVPGQMDETLSLLDFRTPGVIHESTLNDDGTSKFVIINDSIEQISNLPMGVYHQNPVVLDTIDSTVYKHVIVTENILGNYDETLNKIVLNVAGSTIHFAPPADPSTSLRIGAAKINSNNDALITYANLPVDSTDNFVLRVFQSAPYDDMVYKDRIYAHSKFYTVDKHEFLSPKYEPIPKNKVTLRKLNHGDLTTAILCEVSDAISVTPVAGTALHKITLPLPDTTLSTYTESGVYFTEVTDDNYRHSILSSPGTINLTCDKPSERKTMTYEMRIDENTGEYVFELVNNSETRMYNGRTVFRSTVNTPVEGAYNPAYEAPNGKYPFYGIVRVVPDSADYDWTQTFSEKEYHWENYDDSTYMSVAVLGIEYPSTSGFSELMRKLYLPDNYRPECFILGQVPEIHPLPTAAGDRWLEPGEKVEVFRYMVKNNPLFPEGKFAFIGNDSDDLDSPEEYARGLPNNYMYGVDRDNKTWVSIAPPPSVDGIYDHSAVIFDLEHDNIDPYFADKNISSDPYVAPNDRLRGLTDVITQANISFSNVRMEGGDLYVDATSDIDIKNVGVVMGNIDIWKYYETPTAFGGSSSEQHAGYGYYPYDTISNNPSSALTLQFKGCSNNPNDMYLSRAGIKGMGFCPQTMLANQPTKILLVKDAKLNIALNDAGTSKYVVVYNPFKHDKTVIKDAARTTPQFFMGFYDSFVKNDDGEYEIKNGVIDITQNTAYYPQNTTDDKHARSVHITYENGEINSSACVFDYNDLNISRVGGPVLTLNSCRFDSSGWWVSATQDKTSEYITFNKDAVFQGWSDDLFFKHLRPTYYVCKEISEQTLASCLNGEEINVNYGDFIASRIGETYLRYESSSLIDKLSNGFMYFRENGKIYVAVMSLSSGKDYRYPYNFIPKQAGDKIYFRNITKSTFSTEKAKIDDRMNRPGDKIICVMGHWGLPSSSNGVIVGNDLFKPSYPAAARFGAPAEWAKPGAFINLDDAPELWTTNIDNVKTIELPDLKVTNVNTADLNTTNKINVTFRNDGEAFDSKDYGVDIVNDWYHPMIGQPRYDENGNSLDKFAMLHMGIYTVSEDETKMESRTPTDEDPLTHYAQEEHYSNNFFGVGALGKLFYDWGRSWAFVVANDILPVKRPSDGKIVYGKKLVGYVQAIMPMQIDANQEFTITFDMPNHPFGGMGELMFIVDPRYLGDSVINPSGRLTTKGDYSFENDETTGKDYLAANDFNGISFDSIDYKYSYYYNDTFLVDSSINKVRMYKPRSTRLEADPSQLPIPMWSDTFPYRLPNTDKFVGDTITFYAPPNFTVTNGTEAVIGSSTYNENYAENDPLKYEITLGTSNIVISAPGDATPFIIAPDVITDDSPTPLLLRAMDKFYYPAYRTKNIGQAYKSVVTVNSSKVSELTNGDYQWASVQSLRDGNYGVLYTQYTDEDLFDMIHDVFYVPKSIVNGMYDKPDVPEGTEYYEVDTYGDAKYNMSPEPLTRNTKKLIFSDVDPSHNTSFSAMELLKISSTPTQSELSFWPAGFETPKYKRVKDDGSANIYRPDYNIRIWDQVTKTNKYLEYNIIPISVTTLHPTTADMYSPERLGTDHPLLRDENADIYNWVKRTNVLESTGSFKNAILHKTDDISGIEIDIEGLPVGEYAIALDPPRYIPTDGHPISIYNYYPDDRIDSGMEHPGRVTGVGFFSGVSGGDADFQYNNYLLFRVHPDDLVFQATMGMSVNRNPTFKLDCTSVSRPVAQRAGYKVKVVATPVSLIENGEVLMTKDDKNYYAREGMHVIEKVVSMTDGSNDNTVIDMEIDGLAENQNYVITTVLPEFAALSSVKAMTRKSGRPSTRAQTLVAYDAPVQGAQVNRKLADGSLEDLSLTTNAQGAFTVPEGVLKDGDVLVLVGGTNVETGKENKVPLMMRYDLDQMGAEDVITVTPLTTLATKIALDSEEETTGIYSTQSASLVGMGLPGDLLLRDPQTDPELAKAVALVTPLLDAALAAGAQEDQVLDKLVLELQKQGSLEDKAQALVPEVLSLTTLDATQQQAVQEGLEKSQAAVNGAQSVEDIQGFQNETQKTLVSAVALVSQGGDADLVVDLSAVPQLAPGGALNLYLGTGDFNGTVNEAPDADVVAPELDAVEYVVTAELERAELGQLLDGVRIMMSVDEVADLDLQAGDQRYEQVKARQVAADSSLDFSVLSGLGMKPARLTGKFNDSEGLDPVTVDGNQVPLDISGDASVVVASALPKALGGQMNLTNGNEEVLRMMISESDFSGLAKFALSGTQDNQGVERSLAGLIKAGGAMGDVLSASELESGVVSETVAERKAGHEVLLNLFRAFPPSPDNLGSVWEPTDGDYLKLKSLPADADVNLQFVLRTSLDIVDPDNNNAVLLSTKPSPAESTDFDVSYDNSQNTEKRVLVLYNFVFRN